MEEITRSLIQGKEGRTMDMAVKQISGEYRAFETRDCSPMDFETLGKMSLEELLYYVLVGDGRPLKPEEM
jgi:hypothetical protein